MKQPHSGRAVERIGRTMREAQEAYKTGQLATALKLGREAETAAEAIAKTELSIKAKHLLANTFRQIGRVRASLRVNQQAQRLARTGVSPQFQIDLLQQESFLRFTRLEIATARSLADEALSLATITGDHDRMANAETAIALTREIEGEASRALTLYQDAIRSALQGRNMLRYITAESDIARLLTARGEYSEAMEHLEVSDARAHEHHWVKDQIINAIRRTDIMRDRDVVSARTVGDGYMEAMDRARKYGFVREEAEAIDRLGLLKFQQGELSAAADDFMMAWRLWDRHGFKIHVPIARFHFAETLRASGSLDGAVTEYLAILDLTKAQYAHTGALVDPALQQLIAVLAKHRPAKLSAGLVEVAQQLHDSFALKAGGPLTPRRSRRELLVALPAMVDDLLDQPSRWLVVGSVRVDSETGHTINGGQPGSDLTGMTLRIFNHMATQKDRARYVPARELYQVATNTPDALMAQISDETVSQSIRQHIAIIRRVLGDPRHVIAMKGSLKTTGKPPAGAYRLAR